MSRILGFSHRWHALKALAYIPDGARVLDVVCHRGQLLFLDTRLNDESCDDKADSSPGVMHAVFGSFPQRIPCGKDFDAVTAFNVIEEIPLEERAAFMRDLTERLRPGGRFIVSTPSAFGRLLRNGKRNGNGDLSPLQGVPLRLVSSGRFQLGLSRLFVFEKDGESARSA